MKTRNAFQFFFPKHVLGISPLLWLSQPGKHINFLFSDNPIMVIWPFASFSDPLFNPLFNCIKKRGAGRSLISFLHSIIKSPTYIKRFPFGMVKACDPIVLRGLSESILMKIKERINLVHMFIQL